MTATVERSQPRPLASLRRPLLTFVAIALALYIVVGVAHAFLPEAKDSHGEPPINAPSMVDGWMHFDAGWYTYIADHGYYFIEGQQSPVAFFPAYPLAMRALSHVVGNTAVAGLIITFVSGAVVAMLWWTWVKDHVRERARGTAFLLLLLYPYAWYLYGSVYADALFLACVLGAFVLVDRGHYWWAALVGAIATSARPVAPAVVIGLLAVALHRSGAFTRDRTADADRPRVRFDRSKLSPGVLGVGASVAGLGAYCTYLWIKFGDPIAFLTTQSAPGWDQGAGPRTWFKIQFFELLFDRTPFVIRLFPPAIATVFFLVAIPFVWRRFGWGYGVYTAVVVIIPAMGSGDFQGMARYLLAAFPVFALVAEWLVRSDLRTKAALAVGAVGLLTGATLFGTGFYLA